MTSKAQRVELLLNNEMCQACGGPLSSYSYTMTTNKFGSSYVTVCNACRVDFLMDDSTYYYQFDIWLAHRQKKCGL